jgi:hypothetical protein
VTSKKTSGKRQRGVNYSRKARCSYWIACLPLNGRRTNRSTKTSDRRLANRLADEWQAAANKAREGHLVETQARKILNDILSHIGQEPLRSETVESFFSQWLSGKGDGNTASRYSGTVDRFLDHLGGKRNLPVAGIGHEEILGFMEKRAGVAPKTLSVEPRMIVVLSFDAE